MHRYLHPVRLGLRLAFTLVILGCGTGCETMKQVKFKAPKVSAKDLNIEGASFQDLNLKLDLAVDNPSSFATSLAAFSYSVLVDDKALVTGTHDEPTTFSAGTTSTFSVPLTLTFDDLFKTIPSLLKQDSFDYQINADLSFATPFPVIGDITIPIQKSGNLPIIRPPTIQGLALEKKALTLSGADLALKLNISNPNRFALALNGFDYTFKGNGQNWASGNIATPTRLPEQGDQEFTIPIQLNFLAIGTTAFQLLSGGGDFNTKLSGTMSLGSSLEYLQNMSLPIDVQKTLKLGSTTSN